jgi:hypothetical protein
MCEWYSVNDKFDIVVDASMFLGGAMGDNGDSSMISALWLVVIPVMFLGSLPLTMMVFWGNPQER